MHPLLGVLIQKSAKIGAIASQRRRSYIDLQENQLQWLLHKAGHTAFGRAYHFHNIRNSADPVAAFQARVPATDYNGLYNEWWSKAHLCDAPDVCWPGVTPYYALSSGTSQAATKYIPVTDDMLKAMKRGARRMFFNLTRFGVAPRQFARQVLMVGSCTRSKTEGLHQTGDLSGIIGLNRPLWMEPYYRPGRVITDLPEWEQRIDRIAAEAPGWDIAFVVGNPMWVQLIFERIIERHGVQHIHDIWPDFGYLIHGGVFFEPYRQSFSHLLGKKISTIDSYMASEGLFGYQARPDQASMQLVPDGGVFFEFVPFDDHNFDENGDLRTAFPEVHRLETVQEGRHYALLLSTCSGAWRYLLGDTIQFTDTARFEFRLTGRTKQFLSVCGEHLSIDNLNQAVEETDRAFGAGVREFTVAGVRNGIKWAHEWFVSFENPDIDAQAFIRNVDAVLCRLNDDYATERRYALDAVRIRVLPQNTFTGWLQHKGKMNGQAKIPRVMKSAQWADFQKYITEKFSVSASCSE